ncbi:hypothetical protein WJX84_007439 [Apatococcus fuscideae]|uniref:Uncharacterized protein n=1 Tax=Apatococcus fuscideae TaxID=2026836 RepID=A0AAW1TEZ5_9CHLO
MPPRKKSSKRQSSQSASRVEGDSAGQELVITGEQAIQQAVTEAAGQQISNEPYEPPCTVGGLMAGLSGGALGYIIGFDFCHHGSPLCSSIMLLKAAQDERRCLEWRCSWRNHRACPWLEIRSLGSLAECSEPGRLFLCLRSARQQGRDTLGTCCLHRSEGLYAPEILATALVSCITAAAAAITIQRAGMQRLIQQLFEAAKTGAAAGHASAR